VKEVVVEKKKEKPTKVKINKEEKEKSEHKLKQIVDKPVVPKKTKSEIAAAPMKAIKDVQDSIKQQTEATIKKNEQ